VTTPRLYLDHNATTPLRPEAREAMLSALDLSAAASSPHAEGRRARAVVEAARTEVAALVGAHPADVLFTSGATEANATALTPHWQVGRDARPLDRLITSTIEHASVLAGSRFPTLAERLPVGPDGRAEVEPWRQRMSELRQAGERPLVSLMLANNETGVLQPVAEIAAAVHEAGGLLHCDAAQAAGKVPVAIARLGADLLTLSGHKLGGPQGVGALVKAGDTLHLSDPLLRGGGQERGLRSGTENVPAIAGFGAAAAAARKAQAADGERLCALRDHVEAVLRERHPGLLVFGDTMPRLPNTLAFAIPGLAAETLLMALDLAGIAVSSGSACSSGKVKPSHVLAAMGIPDEVLRGALRLSLGTTTTSAEVETFLEAFNRTVEGLHVRRRSRAA
jgi:cysteine desulfurase